MICIAYNSGGIGWGLGGTGCLFRHIYRGLCKKERGFLVGFWVVFICSKTSIGTPKLSLGGLRARVMKKVYCLAVIMVSLKFHCDPAHQCQENQQDDVVQEKMGKNVANFLRILQKTCKRICKYNFLLKLGSRNQGDVSFLSKFIIKFNLL